MLIPNQVTIPISADQAITWTRAELDRNRALDALILQGQAINGIVEDLQALEARMNARPSRRPPRRRRAGAIALLAPLAAFLVPDTATAAAAATATTTTNGGSTKLPIGRSYTIDVGAGATVYFGKFATATSSDSGGLSVGRDARKVKSFQVGTSAAFGAGVSGVFTIEMASSETGAWTQIGTGSVSLTASSGLFSAVTNLNADGSETEIPAGYFVRMKLVATGDPASLTYAWELS